MGFSQVSLACERNSQAFTLYRSHTKVPRAYGSRNLNVGEIVKNRGELEELEELVEGEEEVEGVVVEGVEEGVEEVV